MARALNANEFLNKQFQVLPFTGSWLSTFGEPENNFSMIIYGKSGQGKTELCIMFAKYLTRFGRVLYNSFEQGYSKSLQDAIRRQGLDEVSAHILFTHKERYDAMVSRLKKKKSPRIVFIDSVQYIKLAYEQWQELRNLFPKKMFIMIAHAEGDEPKGGPAKAIEFDVDIKVLVKGYQAHPKSRFGGNEPYTIWEEGFHRWLLRQNKGKHHATPTAQPQLFPVEENKKEAV
ncbi:MAG TPA: ATP-binding protein [Panacibacter sp.]|nr:ATP-binding protein [Panacibacter sp.]HNP46940.1 ATP-binding protein [Panacibacter sp.]